MSVRSDHDGEVGQAMRVLSNPHTGWDARCETARGLLAPRVPAPVQRTAPSTRVSPGVDADAFKSWSAESQERALELIRQRQMNPWRPFYCPRTDCDGRPHDKWDWPHARADQRPPPVDDDWLVWLLMSGRGSGKTRTGAEMIHRVAKKVPRIHLIAATGPDLRDTMIEGVSGLQVTAPPDFIPQWEPSKKRLTWPNGAIAIGFSGEEPDRLRGPQCYYAWIDEPAHMPLIRDVWDNLLFGLRLGKAPRIIATSTPLPTKWMKELAKDEQTRISRASTYANIDNLADTYKRTVLKRYEGTRLGRQELHGEILEDVEGSLWKAEWFRYIHDLPLHFDRIVVGIDPAGTKNKTSDETGLVVMGVIGDVLYVLEDATNKYSPSGWATKAVALYEKWSADALVPEVNYGGDMVAEVLNKNGAKNINIRTVTSRRGKSIRAEPIVALYEKGTKSGEDRDVRVWHYQGATELLEGEQTTWVPGQGDSPNRIDAMVHAATDLAVIASPAEMADPSKLTHTVPTGSYGGRFGGRAGIEQLIRMDKLRAEQEEAIQALDFETAMKFREQLRGGE